MDKLTVKKIIEINCKKRCSSLTERKKLQQNYYDFFDNIDDEYKLEITEELSICDTPTVSINSKKLYGVPSIYLWCFDGFFYLKTPTANFCSNSLESVLNKIDNYFYPSYEKAEL